MFHYYPPKLVMTSASVVPGERSNAGIVTEPSVNVADIARNERVTRVQRQGDFLRLGVDDDLARQRRLEHVRVLEVERRGRVELLESGEIGRGREHLRARRALQGCERERAEGAELGVGVPELELERGVGGVGEKRALEGFQVGVRHDALIILVDDTRELLSWVDERGEGTRGDFISLQSPGICI